MPKEGGTLRVEGAANLRRTLKKAGDDLGDLKDTHAAVAGIVAPVARTYAPKRTGRLSSTVRTGATKRAAIIRAGRASVPYANVIHWGWPVHHIRAQPFVLAASRRTEPAWAARYHDAVEKILAHVKGV